MKEIIKKILKALPNAVKNFFYGDIKTDIKNSNAEIKSDIKEIKNDFNSSEKDRLRYEIISFASSLRRGELRTTQEFETIFHFHDKYESLIEKLGEKNGFTHSEFLYIEERYKELIENDSFFV